MDEVDHIIESIPLLRGQTWERVYLDGWSNRSLLLTAKQDAYVLRIPLNPLKTHVDRYHEYVNLQSLIPLHITPETLYFDSKTGVQLRNYVGGQTLSKVWMTDEKLTLCAKLLRRLHDSKIRFEPINMTARLFEDCENLRAQGVDLDQRYEQLLAYCTTVVDRLYCERYVPCHMDPNLYNFIFGERLWLIDFEYAHQYDPAWDLAYFITSAKLNDEQIRIFCEGYMVGPDLLERILVFKPLTQFSQAIWVQQQLQLGHTQVSELVLREWEREALASAVDWVR